MAAAAGEEKAVVSRAVRLRGAVKVPLRQRLRRPRRQRLQPSTMRTQREHSAGLSLGAMLRRLRLVGSVARCCWFCLLLHRSWGLMGLMVGQRVAFLGPRGVWFRLGLWPLFACSPVRLFACPSVRLSVCSPVRLFACSPVRLFACSPIRLFAEVESIAEEDGGTSEAYAEAAQTADEGGPAASGNVVGMRPAPNAAGLRQPVGQAAPGAEGRVLAPTPVAGPPPPPPPLPGAPQGAAWVATAGLQHLEAPMMAFETTDPRIARALRGQWNASL